MMSNRLSSDESRSGLPAIRLYTGNELTMTAKIMVQITIWWRKCADVTFLSLYWVIILTSANITIGAFSNTKTRYLIRIAPVNAA